MPSSTATVFLLYWCQVKAPCSPSPNAASVLHDHAQNDIVLKRSSDNGKSWGPEIVVHEDGMNSINDPLTVQLDDGRVMLMFARFPYGRHSRNSGWIKMAETGYDNPGRQYSDFRDAQQ